MNYKLFECLEEVSLNKSQFVEALKLWGERNEVKLSTSRQAFYNWRKNGTNPDEDTRKASVGVLNLAAKKRGLDREYTLSEVFPSAPPVKLNAEDLI